MKTLLALIAMSAGCLCGGYTGGNDKVLSRDTDSIILCDNNGFIATTAAYGVIEGTYSTFETTNVVATRGDTGTIAFQLIWSADLTTATTSDLGDGTWTKRDMNMVELDHADVQCQALVSRSWWSAE